MSNWLTKALFGILGCFAAFSIAMTESRASSHDDADTAMNSRYVLEFVEAVARADEQNDDHEARETTLKVIELRLAPLELSKTSIALNGENQIIVEIEGKHNPKDIESVLGLGPKLEFAIVEAEVTPNEVENIELKQGMRILPLPERQMFAVLRTVDGLGGERVSNAIQGIDPVISEPVIHISFDEQGKKLFGRLTADNVGRMIAVVLDDEVIVTPTVLEPILGGHVQISGNFTTERAEQVAISLRSGSLPAAVRIVEHVSIP